MRSLLLTIFLAVSFVIFYPDAGTSSPTCRCDGYGGGSNIYGLCSPDVCRRLGSWVNLDRSREQSTDDDPIADDPVPDDPVPDDR